MSTARSDSLGPSVVVRESALSIGYGLVAGALAGLPAVFRALGAHTSTLLVLGACALPMAYAVPVVLGVRRARLPQAPSPGHEQRPHALAEVGGALALALGPLYLLGTWLTASTHHRPLGAVTFSLVGAAVLVVAYVAARRVLHARRRGIVLAGLGVPGALSAYLLLRGLAAGIDSGPGWLDGLAWVGWTLGACWLPPLRKAGQPVVASPSQVSPSQAPSPPAPASRGALRVSFGAWLVVCAVAVVALGTHLDELTAIAPAFTWPVR